VLRVGLVVEAAVGEGTAEALVEEQKEQRDLHALGGEAVGVAGTVALEQPVALELAQVVAELVEAVGLLREVEGGADGVVDLPRRRAADLRSAMQENLAEANDARVVDLEAGIADGADGDRAGEALQQREVDVDVEPLRLEAGKAIGDRLERRANSVEMVQHFKHACPPRPAS